MTHISSGWAQLINETRKCVTMYPFSQQIDMIDTPTSTISLTVSMEVETGPTEKEEGDVTHLPVAEVALHTLKKRTRVESSTAIGEYMYK